MDRRSHRLRIRETKAQRVIPCAPDYFVLPAACRGLPALPDK